MGVSSNIDEVKKLLAQFGPEVGKELEKKVISRATTRMKRYVANEVPVKSGKLKKSIRARTKKYRNGKVRGLVNMRLGYYATLIYGERKGPAAAKVKQYKNWFDAGMERGSEPVTQLMGQMTKDIIRRHAVSTYTKSLTKRIRRLR